MTEARGAVLTRIRRALEASVSAPVPQLQRTYTTTGSLGDRERLDLLEERLRDYRAAVTRVPGDSLADAVADALHRRAAQRVVVPPSLDVVFPDDVAALVDDGLTATALDATDAVVTRCAVAIAQTGTIVLDAGTGQGRRALTLVPDFHLCIVDADQVVETVPEALARLEPTRPLTWISGPSATSDIELQRVEGVHGPRTLHVVLVGPD